MQARNWRTIALISVALLLAVSFAQSAEWHHGDCCDVTRERFDCDGTTHVYDRVWWAHCNYRNVETRACMPGTYQCLPIGSVHSIFEHPSLDRDHDGDGYVDLHDYAIVQLEARRSCP